MSPDPKLPLEFGRNPAAATRAAVVLALLGCGLVVLLGRFLMRPNTPLGEALRSAGIHPWLALLPPVAVVLALSVWGYYKASRAAPCFRLTEEGLEVEGMLGRYLLAWDNVAEARVTPSGSLGIRVRDREALLATHQGTEQQREWLRTMQPFGEWDFSFLPVAELGYPAEKVLGWMKPHLKEDPSP